MDLVSGLRRQRRAWRAVFFCALAVFALFWAWMLAAAATGRSPVSLLLSVSSGRDRGETAAPVPVSSYVGEDYGVLSITPADNSTASVNGNGRRIVVAFRQPMDASRALTSWELRTHGGEELDLGAVAWPDATTFTVTLNRDLLPGERVALSLRFRKAGGEPVRPMQLTYE